MSGARGKATIGHELARSEICMRGAARPNCHTLMLSLGTPSNASTASMPAAARPYCILNARNFGMLAIFPDRFCGGVEGPFKQHVTSRDVSRTICDFVRERAGITTVPKMK